MQGDQQGDDAFSREVQEVMRQHARPRGAQPVTADNGGIAVTGGGNHVHYHAAPTGERRRLGAWAWAVVLSALPALAVVAASHF